MSQFDEEIFEGKSFSDLLEDIYTNSIKKEILKLQNDES